jgi:hypothetical protein
MNARSGLGSVSASRGLSRARFGDRFLWSRLRIPYPRLRSRVGLGRTCFEQHIEALLGAAETGTKVIEVPLSLTSIWSRVSGSS